ncbi:MAG TPA: MFS transporter [Bryobacteraceae bacterium]|nr:MFS transporter [Bryobacteraceae bacterium]
MLRRVFRSFQYRDFRLMWTGACLSTIGTWMQTTAQAWLVYDLSHKSLYLGLDAFLAQVPIILFSLVGGVFADRTNRKNLLLGSQYIQMTTAAILTLLVAFGVVRVWHILCLSFIVGVAQSFGGPAYSALLPSLVSREDIPNAIAMNSIQFNLARVIGPTLGGLALTGLGAQWCFGLNALSFIAVIISLYLINVRFIPAKSTEPILNSMRKGIGFIREKPGMDALIILAFGMTLLGIPLLTFLPVFARDVLHGGPTTFTRLLSFSGAGSVCGALVVAGVGKIRGQGRAVLMVLILWGALILGFSVSKFLPLSYALIFLSGSALMISLSMVSSLVQAVASDEMRGRVMSVYNVAFRGGMPVGSLVLGWLIPAFTAPVTMAWTGCLLAVLGMYFLFVQRRVAEL